MSKKDKPKQNNQSRNKQSKKNPEKKQTNDSQSQSLDAQLADLKNKNLQLMADFQNYKKRMDQERATFGAIANMGLIQEILEVYDDLELAIVDEQLDLERAKSSIQNAQSKLINAAKIAGIEKVEVEVGSDFDKEKMEAISTVPNPEMKDKVIAVISSAYKYVGKDGILKAAKVIVGK